MEQEPRLTIRAVATDEHATCTMIHANAWNGALPAYQRKISVADFEGETEGEQIFVGILNGQIVAYISIWEPDWFIHHLYVDPLAQRAGLGSALISHSEKLAGQQPLSLKCQLANAGALGFYRSLGFVESTETGTDEFGSWVRLVKNRV